MATNKEVPIIRFKGFEEKWEPKKLGEISESYSGGTPSVGVKSYYNGEIPFIRSGEINSPLTELFITENGLLNSSAKMVEVGDILYALYGATSGEVGISKIKGAINQAILAIKPKNTYNNFFLAYWLRKKKAEIVSTYLQGGQGNLSGNIIKSLKVLAPLNSNCLEQAQIGDFFKELDRIINLQEHKLEKVKNLKKAMLEKMFTKEHDATPELRFKGFTETWEKKKLEDCLITSTDKNLENKFDKNDVLSVSGDVGIVNQIAFQGRSFAGVSVANYGIVCFGDVVYTKSPLKANPYGIIKANKGKDGIVSTLYAVYKVKENIDASFVEYYFDLDNRLNKYLKPLVNKGAKNDMKISDDNALKGYVTFPKQKIEQKKIANFFQTLDQLIVETQLKTEKVKHLKQALLQKMFI